MAPSARARAALLCKSLFKNLTWPDSKAWQRDVLAIWRDWADDVHGHLGDRSDRARRAMAARGIDMIFLLSPTTTDARVLHAGALGRGFLCDEAGIVVVTDAEIFGRYKVQRPRRLKSPHALAVKSALDGFASIAFAASFGWGVAASAVVWSSDSRASVTGMRPRAW